MKTVTYSIPNISCSHCVHTIQSEVSELEGVQSVKADIVSHQAVVVFDDPATDEKIRQLLAEINYPAQEE
ncbi:MAG TPA: heavy-metal-associated domain-containing protein [Levilinea sp.]|nr:heavy-metal-associated domain-containing protein [Levilinea sp.]